MATAYIGESDGKPVEMPLEVLRRHFFSLGSSGSGKTVLSKVLIEEVAKNGVPAIAVDPQGDLASLILAGDEAEMKKHGIDPLKAKEFSDAARVTIFTPISSKGVPICLNPLEIDDLDVSDEEIIPILHQISSSLIKLLGYVATNDKGKAAETVIYTVLKNAFENGKKIGSFDTLARMLSPIDEELMSQVQPFLSSAKELEELIRKIRFLTVGEKELLFNFGVPLDIDMLLGRGKFTVKDKTQVSIIYLNTLTSQEEKEFFLSILTTKLYQWMLQNPSEDLNCLYFIDEVAPFIPAGSEKPIPKPILKLLFKQARKYGVSCMIATQNPGDIDYKAFAQFGTWAIGRLTVKQDQKKVENALKSLSPIDISTRLPKLSAGQFLLFSPDFVDDIIQIQVRWLYTDHLTMTDTAVKKAIPKELRDSYAKYSKKTIRRKTKAPVEPTKPEAKTVTATIEPAQEMKERHFPLLVQDADISSIVERFKKKHFLIGPAKEDLAAVDLKLRPILLLQVTQSKTNLLKKIKHSQHQVMVDGKSGEILTFGIDRFESIPDFARLLTCNDAELAVLSHLARKRTHLYPADISLALKLTKQKVTITLKSLVKKKLVTYQKVGRDLRYFSIIDLPEMKVPQIESKLPDMSKAKIKGFAEGAKVQLKDVERAIKGWFDGALVVDHEMIYLPVYSIRYQGKNGERTVLINGMTGLEMIM
jgi:DNA helicase HerA-like ATPase/DNA-binding MarR family transcriptional regulator